MRTKWRCVFSAIWMILALSSLASAATLTGLKLEPVDSLGAPTNAEGSWSTGDAASPLGVALNAEFQNQGTETPPLGPIAIPLEPLEKGTYIISLFGDGIFSVGADNQYYGCTLTLKDASNVSTEIEVLTVNGAFEHTPIALPGGDTFVYLTDGTKLEVLAFAVSSSPDSSVLTDHMPPAGADTTGTLVLKVSQPPVCQSETVTLSNGYKITFLGVENDYVSGTSTWSYSVTELPEAQDLSNWVLELPDINAVVTASPEPYEIVHPDPNAHLYGIKWQPGGGFEEGTFTFTLQGIFEVGIVQVAAKGPDVAFGEICGPAAGGEPIDPGQEVKTKIKFAVKRAEAPLTIAFADRSKGNITSWLWDFGDGQTSTEQNPVHTYSAKGKYRMVLTLNKGLAGEKTKSKTIRVRK